MPLKSLANFSKTNQKRAKEAGNKNRQELGPQMTEGHSRRVFQKVSSKFSKKTVDEPEDQFFNFRVKGADIDLILFYTTYTNYPTIFACKSQPETLVR